MKRATCVCLGGAVTLAPFAAGVVVLCDPLRRKIGDAEFVLITTLDALPVDGVPRKFTVRADKEDAWNKFPDTAVGAIYLRRIADSKVHAFNVVCPHLGCAIEYRGEAKDYLCPCHNSTFDLETGTQSPDSPSARGLDSLETKIENGGEIWVRFQNFHTGISEKKPIV